jgi:hypothetical protein
MTTTRYGVTIKGDCDHQLCQCIKDAIETEMLPAAYDHGYVEGADHLLQALPTIIESYEQSKRQGIEYDTWIHTMTSRIGKFVASGLKQENVTIQEIETSGKEAIVQ